MICIREAWIEESQNANTSTTRFTSYLHKEITTSTQGTSKLYFNILFLHIKIRKLIYA